MKTTSYPDTVKILSDTIQSADFLLIGAGAGLSAAGGLDFLNPELFESWFPELKAERLHTIGEAIAAYESLKAVNRGRFWAYWANHIQKVRYESPALMVYQDLYALVQSKNHFIITTNMDSQFEKSGFNQQRIYAPQGNYGLFQCSRPCNNAVYENQQIIARMINNMDHRSYTVKESDIPRCPSCGDYLERNLRMDRTFVEEPHLRMKQQYLNYIRASMSGKLVLLELGVGYNTPSIIRWPFETLLEAHPRASLLRINKDYATVSEDLEAKSICLNDDIAKVVRDILMAE